MLNELEWWSLCCVEGSYCSDGEIKCLGEMCEVWCVERVEMMMVCAVLRVPVVVAGKAKRGVLP